MKRTEEELTELARKLYRGEIFTSAQLHPSDHHLMPMVFIPLGFADEALKEQIARDNPAVVFGRMSEALPRGINGYPMFPSCAFLDKEEWDVVTAKYDKIRAAMESI